MDHPTTTTSARIIREPQNKFMPHDTFGATLHSSFAQTERQHNSQQQSELTSTDKHAQYSTYAAWKQKSQQLAPPLDLDKLAKYQSLHSGEHKSYFELTPYSTCSTPTSDDLTSFIQNRTIRSDPVPKHRLIPESDPNHPTAKPAIPGYSGHRQGQICRELVRPVPPNGEEDVLRQDLTVNSSANLKIGYDFSTYAPRPWGSSTSQSYLSESAKLTKRPKFQFTEKAFRRSSSDFVKHGMLSLKFARAKNNESVMLKKSAPKTKFGSSSPSNWN